MLISTETTQPSSAPSTPPHTHHQHITTTKVRPRRQHLAPGGGHAAGGSDGPPRRRPQPRVVAPAAALQRAGDQRVWWVALGAYALRRLTIGWLLGALIACRIECFVLCSPPPSLNPTNPNRHQPTPTATNVHNCHHPTDDASYRRIYTAITAWWAARARLPDPVTARLPAVVAATLSVYSALRRQLLPTPAKSHYVYNMRDLGKVFQVGWWGVGGGQGCSFFPGAVCGLLWVLICFFWRWGCLCAVMQQQGDQHKSSIHTHPSTHPSIHPSTHPSVHPGYVISGGSS